MPPAKVVDFQTFEHELAMLTAHFEQHRAAYMRPDYSESSLRLEYLDKIFNALGWDVNNSQRVAPHLREVVIENRTDDNERVKRADYVFFIGGIPKLVVEAKNPRENVDRAAFQIQNYAYNLRLFIGMTINFNELRLYVVPSKPSKDNPFPPAPSWHLHYKEYRGAARRIWDLFARDNVANGSIEQYLQQLEKIGGRTAKQLWLIKPDRTKTVDSEFLAYLELQRAQLAKYLHRDNPRYHWGQHGLNEAVQLIIDRVLFQRVCQDRDIDTFDRLEITLDEWNRAGKHKNGLWTLLVSNFRKMATTFNGGLYGRRNAPPHFVDKLIVRDTWLRSFIEELGSDDSPYLFSTLPVEILGSAYERFLGSIVQPDGSVVLKPEVRKAGGVYYTPQYVVDDIVSKTIDPLIFGKTPAQIRRLRFLDPACGSGSFLLRVFERLCEYHVEWLLANPSEQRSQLCYRDSNGGDFRLTTALKRQILVNNIFGIDIDEQAVEVTQLSLYLKLLENENRESLKTQLDLLSQEPYLPDLESNIIIANSLMDDDCIDLLEDEHDVAELKPIPMTGAFAPGEGFDAVVGNPPYDVLEKARGTASWPHDLFRAYLTRSKDKDKYASALGGKLNLFRFFVVRSLTLLKAGGRFGMILPLSLLADVSCSQTRRHVLTTTRNLHIDCFPQKDDPNRRIFYEAKLSTGIFTCERVRGSRGKRNITLRVFPGNKFTDRARENTLSIVDLKMVDALNTPIPMVDAYEWEILKSVHNDARVTRFGAVKGFSITRGEINQSVYRDFITDEESDARLLKGNEVAPYYLRTKLSQGKIEWFAEGRFLAKHKEKKQTTSMRIATQRITGVDERLRIVAAIVSPPAYFADSTNSIVVLPNSPYKIEYILGLLNSKFFQWRFRVTSTNNNVGTNELKSLPFRKIDFSSLDDVALHDRMVVLVRRLTKLYKGPVPAATADRRRYDTLIQETTDRIDNLVEEIFGLTCYTRRPWNEWVSFSRRAKKIPNSRPIGD